MHYLHGTTTKIEVLDTKNFLKSLSKYVDYEISEQEDILDNALIIVLSRNGTFIENKHLGEDIKEHFNKNTEESEFMLNFNASRRSRYQIHDRFKVKKPNVTVPPGWTLKNRVQHMLRFHEIMSFMKNHYLSTRYFYNEALRMRRTGQVSDELRRMLFYLDTTGRRNNVTKKVLQCYAFYKDKGVGPPRWNNPTNNLAIETIKDPQNENTLN
ncbi:unnamed protein product [Arctia plantaginis]|uniref:Uncharacterized protein n=1 Tax=Arctia plantaginis TaxID=874455 RepID=A0A8S1BFQ7_ARCPL|nr:unnamed protein product [Arctia plantaginis]